MPVLLNLLGFFWCWLVLALGAFYDLVIPALVVLAVWLGLHLFYSRTRGSDLRILLAALLIGPLIDVVLLHGQWVSYAAHPDGAGYPPIWIAAMWVNFSTLPNHALAWLRQRRRLAPLLGAVLAPTAYLVGDALGTVELQAPIWLPLLIVAIGWAIVFPAMEMLAVARPSSRSAQR